MSPRSRPLGCDPTVQGVPVAYTAMHGVGAETIEMAFIASGFDAPIPVVEQHQPDGTFPTVAFPNPEEPGAMDLLLRTADESGAAIALANDPDADRLGVAIPTPDGRVATPQRRRDRLVVRRPHPHQHLG